MSWQRSGELIVMVLLGGLGSLNGAIIGTAAYLLTEEWLSGFTENWKVIFGPVLVLVVLFARGGLIGRRDRACGGSAVAEAMLRLEGLRKKFGALVVTDDLTFDVRPNELHAVIGPNGAGKTTLINQISGLAAPDAGSILFAGRDITALPMHARAGLGLARTFQVSSILPGFSALENVALAVQARTGSSFRVLGDAADGAGLERSGHGRARRCRPGRARAYAGGAALAWRKTGARTRHRARHATETAAPR